MLTNKKKKDNLGDILFWGFIGLLMVGTLGAVYWYTHAQHLSGYENAEHGLRTTFPKGWEVRPGFQGTIVMVVSPSEDDLDSFQENINITVEDVSQTPMDLDQASALIKKQMDVVFHNIDVTNEEDAEISGYPAHRYVFEANADLHLKVEVHWLVKENKIYIITYMAEIDSFDTYYPLVSRTISDLRFDS